MIKSHESFQISLRGGTHRAHDSISYNNYDVMLCYTLFIKCRKGVLAVDMITCSYTQEFILISDAVNEMPRNVRNMLRDSKVSSIAMVGYSDWDFMMIISED